MRGSWRSRNLLHRTVVERPAGVSSEATPLKRRSVSLAWQADGSVPPDPTLDEQGYIVMYTQSRKQIFVLLISLPLNTSLEREHSPPLA
jgi:hypothetical protein